MSKYLRIFKTHEDYENYIENGVFPNVSICDDTDMHHVHYNNAYHMPYNEIWYTTTDGNILSKLNDPSAFSYDDDLELISHTYENGKGVLKFSGYPTRLQEFLFFETNLSGIWLPDTIEYIESYVFTGTPLTSINVPSSVHEFVSKALSDCNSLTSITVDPNNTTYDSRDNCNSIIETDSNNLKIGCKNTVIPSSVTSIGAEAFYACISLTSIEIPSSVTSIGAEAFYACGSLTSIEIPSSVTSIGADAFYGCTFVESNFINNSSADGYPWGAMIVDEEINGLLIENNQVVAIRPGITSANIPEGVTSIGAYVFYGYMSLTSIEIPDGVTSIGAEAFCECESLTSITCLATTPPSLGGYAFYNTNDCPIYVPAASVNAYKTADGWSEYASRIQAIS